MKILCHLEYDTLDTIYMILFFADNLFSNISAICHGYVRN